MSGQQFLRTPQVKFDNKCTDAWALIDHVAEMTTALAALWRGIPLMKCRNEREAALDAAKCIMEGIKYDLECAESGIKRAQEAHDRLRNRAWVSQETRLARVE